MMQYLDAALDAALSEIERQAPPKLASAINHAVFPGGARIRPRLCHAVAQAAGSDCPPLVSAVATSLELLHCASLVHDDLPCFDAADKLRELVDQAVESVPNCAGAAPLRALVRQMAERLVPASLRQTAA